MHETVFYLHGLPNEMHKKSALAGGGICISYRERYFCLLYKLSLKKIRVSFPFDNIMNFQQEVTPMLSYIAYMGG